MNLGECDPTWREWRCHELCRNGFKIRIDVDLDARRVLTGTGSSGAEVFISELKVALGSHEACSRLE
jgi:hypothetical protein